MLVGSMHLTLNMTLEKMSRILASMHTAPLVSPVFQKSLFLTGLGNGEAWVGIPALPAQAVMAFGLV